MNSPDPSVPFDLPEPLRRLADDLVMWDAALHRGEIDLAAAPPATGDGELDPLRECVQLLHRVWPSSGIESASDEFPRQLGRFQIEGVLGFGGFGIVYLANDTALGRQVALKVPRLMSLADPGLRERFRQEARAAAALDHPHIVPLYETGIEEGIDYIAAAYCAGPDLATWLKEQTLAVSPRRAAALVACLADALHYSHQRGVLHRDLKPANVLLGDHRTSSHVADGDELPFSPRLTDFGLARLLDGAADGSTASAMMGTPSYMAPEQADPRLGQVGPATDIHGLGILLYELLVGRPPFQADSFSDVLDQVRWSEPVPLRKLRRDIPRDLEVICLKCLEKRPCDRYSSAFELEQDLRRFLRGEPLKARPPKAMAVAWKWCQRNRLSAILALLAVLVPAAATIGLALHHHQMEKVSNSLSDSVDKSHEWERQAGERSQTLAQLAYASAVRLADEAFELRDIRQCRAHLEVARRHIATGASPGLEWSVMDSRTRGVHRDLGEPLSEFTAVACAPQGTLLAAGGEGGIVQLIEMSAGTVLRVLKTPHIELRTLAFDPSGKRLAATGEDGSITLWNVADGTLLKSSGWVVPANPNIAWIDAGRRLLVGTDASLRIWNPESDALEELDANPIPTTCVSSSPDGNWFACAIPGSTLRIWTSVETRTKLHSIGGGIPKKVSAMAFNRACDRLAVAYSDEQLVVYRILDTGLEPIEQLPCFDVVRSIAFSPTGHQLAILKKQGIAEIWDLPTDSSTATLRRGWQAHDERGLQIAWSADGTEVATVGYANTQPRVWNAGSPTEIRQLSAVANDKSELLFTADSQTLLIPGNGLECWSMSDLSVAPSHPGQNKPFQHLTISSDGKWLCTNEPGQHLVEMWSYPEVDGQPSWSQSIWRADQLLFSADSDWLAVVNWERDQIQVLARATGAELRTLPMRQCTCATLSPAGDRLVANNSDELVVYKTADWSIERRLRGQVSTIRSLTMSPDGAWLVSAGDGREIHLWQTSDWSKERPVCRHSHGIRKIAFTPDGTSLLALDTLGVISAWNLDTGLKTCRLWSQTDGPARQFSLSPDGRWLAVILEGGQVLLRRLPNPEPH
jgi:serine/threonine protein kinase/WD40 repeat protein